MFPLSSAASAWNDNKIVYYCKFENFGENLSFANSVKRNIYHAYNSRVGKDLPTSVNDRVVLPFGEGFIFAKLRVREVSRK